MRTTAQEGPQVEQGRGRRGFKPGLRADGFTRSGTQNTSACVGWDFIYRKIGRLIAQAATALADCDGSFVKTDFNHHEDYDPS